MSRRGITRGLPQAHTAPTTGVGDLTFTPVASAQGSVALAGDSPVGFTGAAAAFSAPTLTAPAASADVYDGVAVTVSATVNGAPPIRIDFVLDPGGGETVIATDSAAPYSQSWTPSGVSAGAHTLVARYVHASGSVDSTAIDVHVWASVASRAVGAWVPADMTESGGKVTAWANSGTGGATWDLAQGTGANRPTYDATGNRTGGPCASFVAASSTFLLTGAIVQNQPRTVVVVGTLTSKINNMTLADGRNGVGANRIFYSTLGDLYVAAGSFFATGAGDPATDTYYAIQGVFNGASSKAGRDATVADGAAGASNASGLVLGAGSSAGVNPWDGKVERAYLFDFALSNTELALLRTELGF